MLKKILILIMLVLLSGVAFAATLTRTVQSSVQPGEVFPVTYSASSLPSGNWLVTWTDNIGGGCTKDDGTGNVVEGFLISGSGTSISVEISAPSSGSCSFSGDYQFTNEGVKTLPSKTVTVSSASHTYVYYCNDDTILQSIDGNPSSYTTCDSGDICKIDTYPESGTLSSPLTTTQVKGYMCEEEDICLPHHNNYLCLNDDLYWFDNCGVPNDKYVECGAAGCTNGQTVCAQPESCGDDVCQDGPSYDETCGSDDYCEEDCGDCGQGDCGDGIINGQEQCDCPSTCTSTQLAGNTCVTRGYDQGTLRCTAQCQFDTSGCTNVVLCGDGTCDGSETHASCSADCECDTDAQCGDGKECKSHVCKDKDPFDINKYLPVILLVIGLMVMVSLVK